MTAGELTRAPAAPVARVHVPARSLRGDLRAVKIVWQRELIRFSRDRMRIITSLLQPLLFLFVLGSGLSRLASPGTHGVDLRTFVYPGVLAMAVMFTAIFSAASIVWDREFGFLREMLVAPVRRGSIVLGKCFGGATVAPPKHFPSTIEPRRTGATSISRRKPNSRSHTIDAAEKIAVNITAIARTPG
jgi:ABC-2 type transport system permease protein